MTGFPKQMLGEKEAGRVRKQPVSQPEGAGLVKAWWAVPLVPVGLAQPGTRR